MAFPADLQTITVEGTYVTNDGGLAVTGTIEFTSTTRVVSAATHTAVVPGGTVTMPDPVTGHLVDGVLLAEDGTSPLELLATDDAQGSPVGWVWLVTERFTNAISKPPFNLAVPGAGGPIDLPSATPGVPPVIPAGTAVVQIGDVQPNAQGVIPLGLTPGHGIPDTMPPDPHSHPISGVTGLQTALDAKESAGAATAAMTAHVAAGDPHPQYLTPAEALLVHALIVHTHTYADITGVPMDAPFSVSGPASAPTTGVHRWYNNTGRTLNVTAIRASVGTAPTGAALVVAGKKNGVAFSTPLTASIASGTNTAVTAAAGQTVAVGDYLTVDVTAVGTTVAGSDLTVQIALAAA